MTQKNTTRTPDGVEVYENEILFFLDQYLSEHPDIQDLHQEPQSRWNAILRYIYKYTFKGTDKLKSKEYTTLNNNLKHTNNNAYNMDILNNILDLYIDLCFEYGKEVSIIGYSYLTGIDQETIYGWYRENINHEGVEIYKRLSTTREESLSDRLYSSKGNPVGVLGILNHWYGWNMGQPHGAGESKPRTVEQIREQYATESIPAPENTPPAGENTPLLAETPPTEENAPRTAENTRPESSGGTGEQTPGERPGPARRNSPKASEYTPRRKKTPRPKK